MERNTLNILRYDPIEHEYRLTFSFDAKVGEVVPKNDINKVKKMAFAALERGYKVVQDRLRVELREIADEILRNQI